MENSSFEQQFTQSLNAAPLQPANNGMGKSKLPIIISIVLAVIVVVESIALIITMNNYLAIVDEVPAYDEDEGYIEDEEGEEAIDNNYVYNDSDALVAMNANCKATDGSAITLDTSGNYTATGPLAGSGTYTITNDSLISLSGSNKVIYYDGWDLADGLTIYSCEEDTTNTEE